MPEKQTYTKLDTRNKWQPPKNSQSVKIFLNWSVQPPVRTFCLLIFFYHNSDCQVACIAVLLTDAM